MPLIHQVNHLINKILRRIGYKIIRIPEPLSLDAALIRAKSWVPRLGTVIDVGASNGSWSRIVRQYYPDSHYLLIEANEAHEAALANYKASAPNIDYILAAAGSDDGKIYFDSRSLFGGVAASENMPGYESADSVKIDTVVADRRLKAPYCIKLDTHGYELPILKGATETLKHTSVLIIETYNFTLQPNSMRFHEMCAYLDSLGFRPADIIEPLHRPIDNVLWQFDLLFVKSDHQVWKSNNYEGLA